MPKLTEYKCQECGASKEGWEGLTMYCSAKIAPGKYCKNPKPMEKQPRTDDQDTK